MLRKTLIICILILFSQINTTKAQKISIQGFNTPNLVEKVKEEYIQQCNLWSVGPRNDLVITLQYNPRFQMDSAATQYTFPNPKNFTIQTSSSSLDTLRHELVHVILASNAYRSIPRWIDEGSASLSESRMPNLHERNIKSLQNRESFSFNQITSFQEYPPNIHAFYAQSATMADFLMQIGGRESILSYINNSNLKIFGLENFSDFQVKWLDWIKRGHPPAPRQVMQCSTGNCQNQQFQWGPNGWTNIQPDPQPQPQPQTNCDCDLDKLTSLLQETVDSIKVLQDKTNAIEQKTNAIEQNLTGLEQKIQADIEIINTRLTNIETEDPPKEDPPKEEKPGQILYFTIKSGHPTDEVARKLKDQGHQITIITLSPKLDEAHGTPSLFFTDTKKTIRGVSNVTTFFASL